MLRNRTIQNDADDDVFGSKEPEFSGTGVLTRETLPAPDNYENRLVTGSRLVEGSFD
jgi:hypothetical protein